MAAISVLGLNSPDVRPGNPGAPSCPKCGAPLSESGLNQSRLLPCKGCQSLLQVEIFPAFFRRAAPAETGEIVLIEGESTCFYHENKKAVIPCRSCGRFMCALCDCELNGEHFCPACLERGKAKGKIKNLENQRTLYDTIALSLVVLPVITLIFWFMTIVTAPVALFLAVWYWNAPGSIVRRTRMRYFLAIAFATLEIAGWAIGLYSVYSRLYG
jgi:hypothetical protein